MPQQPRSDIARGGVPMSLRPESICAQSVWTLRCPLRRPRIVIVGAAAAATAVAALASVLEEAAVAVVRVEGVRRHLFVR
jgi:hypothetical protein